MVYYVGIIIFAVLFIGTLPYKRKFQKYLDRKEHKLKRLYGMAMFLTDRFLKKWMCADIKLNNSMQQLWAKEDVEKEKYLYIVRKVALSLLVVFGTLVVGIGMSLSEKAKETNTIKSLERDELLGTNYEFTIQKENGSRQEVHIDVPRRELSKKETMELFEEIEKNLAKEVLGENSSVDHVDRKLNLIDGIDEKDVQIIWGISDSQVIGYDGRIGNNLSKEGTLVTLTATLMKGDYMQDYQFSVNVFPTKDILDLEGSLQKYIDASDKTAKEIELPKQINGNTISYYEKFTNDSKWLWAIGLILAVAMFFLKDRDMKKSVEERKNQMLLDYPEIVSKILLYYGAGISIPSAFEKIIKDYHLEKSKNQKLFRYAYEEMEISLNKMKSGVSEMKAIREFGNRCGLHCYIKFANLIEQNIKRGSKELIYALKGEVSEALLERKNVALKQGEKMSTKLLAPMIMMFFVSVTLIIVPALMSIKF